MNTSLYSNRFTPRSPASDRDLAVTLSLTVDSRQSGLNTPQLAESISFELVKSLIETAPSSRDHPEFPTVFHQMRAASQVALQDQFKLAVNLTSKIPFEENLSGVVASQILRDLNGLGFATENISLSISVQEYVGRDALAHTTLPFAPSANFPHMFD